MTRTNWGASLNLLWDKIDSRRLIIKSGAEITELELICMSRYTGTVCHKSDAQRVTSGMAVNVLKNYAQNTSIYFYIWCTSNKLCVIFHCWSNKWISDKIWSPLYRFSEYHFFWMDIWGSVFRYYFYPTWKNVCFHSIREGPWCDAYTCTFSAALLEAHNRDLQEKAAKLYHCTFWNDCSNGFFWFSSDPCIIATANWDSITNNFFRRSIATGRSKTLHAFTYYYYAS